MIMLSVIRPSALPLDAAAYGDNPWWMMLGFFLHPTSGFVMCNSLTSVN